MKPVAVPAGAYVGAGTQNLQLHRRSRACPPLTALTALTARW